jgi:hypothetical protein
MADLPFPITSEFTGDYRIPFAGHIQIKYRIRDMLIFHCATRNFDTTNFVDAAET